MPEDSSAPKGPMKYPSSIYGSRTSGDLMAGRVRGELQKSFVRLLMGERPFS